MKKYLLGSVLMGLIAFSSPASAQFEMGLGYHQLRESGVELGAVVGSMGVRFDISDRFSITPDLRLGVGVNNDRGVEIDNLLGAALRFQLAFNEQFYGYFAPSYTRYALNRSTFWSRRVTNNSSNELGIGGGLGFRVTDMIALEAGYENVDSIDVLSIGARFSF